MELVVYEDDFVAYFQKKEAFYKNLKSRMGHFGMVIEETKSRLIECGKYTEKRYEKEDKKPEIFTFLGFTHYSSYGRDGKFWVKRKTCRKNFAKKCKEVHCLIPNMRTKPLKAIIKKQNEILAGYYHKLRYNRQFSELLQSWCGRIAQ